MTDAPLDDSRYFQGIKACVFDAYGTIFDLISATDQRSAELGDKAGPLGEIWRTKQLQYTWLRSMTGHYTSFWQITQDALDYAMAQLGLDDSVLRDRLLAGYKELKAYDDVAPVLDRLQKAGMGTALLSNGSRDMLAPVVEHAGLTSWLDVVLSVEDSQIFKPDDRV